MSTRVSGEIARYVRTKVSALGYVMSDDRSKPEALYPLKERLYYGPCDIILLSETRFSATIGGPDFNEAVRRDLFDGIIRIKHLERSMTTLAHREAATAWVLTTCYYAAFFAAVELLRCSGRLVSYFGDIEAGKITQRAAVPTPGNLEPGTYEGSANYDAVTGQVTVTYAKRRIRHHDFTWHQLKHIVDQTRKSVTGADGLLQDRLAQFIGSDSNPSWPSPSDTRNYWNYENASLFGPLGERTGAEFTKLAKSKSGALSWGNAKKFYASDEACASSIAFVMNVLIGATDDLSGALLPSSLTNLSVFRQAMG